MFNLLKTVCIIPIIFFISNCTSGVWRLHNPQTPAEGEKQTIVGFGQYKVTSNAIWGEIGSLDSTLNLIEVISVDEKNKKVITGKPFEQEEFIKGGQEGELNVFWGNTINNVISNNDCKPGSTDCGQVISNTIESHFDYFLFLDANKKYAIQSITWAESCGKGCWYTVTWPINLYESYKALPIQGKGGTVNFQGVYKINLINVPDDDRDGYIVNSPNIVDKLFSSKQKRKAIITKVEDIPKEGYYESVKKAYYEEAKVNPKNAEIKFLKNLIQFQKSGYWKDKAEARLATIGK